MALVVKSKINWNVGKTTFPSFICPAFSLSLSLSKKVKRGRGKEQGIHSLEN
jgi:hypothetical protein